MDVGGGSTLGEVQLCLKALSKNGENPPYLVAFGSNPAGLYRWQDGDEDLHLAQDTSTSGHFAQH